MRARIRLRPFRLLPFRLLVLGMLVAACIAAGRIAPVTSAVTDVALRVPAAPATVPTIDRAAPTVLQAPVVRRAGTAVSVAVRLLSRIRRPAETAAAPRLVTVPVGGQAVTFRWHWGGRDARRLVTTGPSGWAMLRLKKVTGRLTVHARYPGAAPYAATAPASARVPAPQTSRSLIRHGVAGGHGGATVHHPASAFVFPFLHPGLAEPPGSWSLDQGVDMFAAGEACGSAAVLVAVGNGVVIQEGISGFGPTAPVVQMTSGPLAGRNVYYGHTGRVYVPVGATVRAGQPIAEIGCGQVGYSAAPHLEIGVGVPGGPPCCPAMHETASEMYRLLAATY